MTASAVPVRTFAVPGIQRVHTGAGSIQRVADEVASAGARRVLVVTSRSLTAQGEVLESLVSILGATHTATYDGCSAHVSRDSLDGALAAARRARADAVVSLGGGSPIDTAKIVALCLARGIDRAAKLDGLEIGGPRAAEIVFASDLPLHVSVSTTLSGAEFTDLAGVTDTLTRVKHAYRAPGMAPTAVILDPLVGAATPSWLWGSTGMRAVDHCVETICSRSPQPFATALCVDALARLAHWLPIAGADDGDDLVSARAECQIAMWMSAYSLTNVPQGASHAIGHQLGARCGVPHGVCSAVMLPLVMGYNLPVTIEAQAIVAAAIDPSVATLPPETAAERAPKLVTALAHRLGISTRLRDWSVAEADLDDVAAHASLDFMADTNPHPLGSVETVRELLRRAW